MNQNEKEGLAVFINAFLTLNERRKGLSEIEKKVQVNIAECQKRIEEVKLRKRKVPFFSPSTNSTVNTNGEITKDIKRRGRRKATEKSVTKSTAASKINLRTKSRKRASDDDILEEQPLSKIRKEITVLKDEDKEKTIVSNKNGTSKLNNVNNSNKSIKPSQVEDKVECENKSNLKEQTISTKQKFSERNVTTTKCNSVISPASSSPACKSVTRIPLHQSSSDENIVDKSTEENKTIKKHPNTTNLKLKSVNCTKNLNNSLSNEGKIELKEKVGLDEKTDESEQVSAPNEIISEEDPASVPVTSNESSPFKPALMQPITVKENEKTITPLMESSSDEDSHTNERKDKTVTISENDFSKLKKVQTESDEVDCMDKTSTVGHKLNKEKDLPVDSTKDSNFVNPPIPFIQITGVTTIIPSSDEESPVKKRFTRSKGKENKVTPNSSEIPSSNEESPVKSAVVQPKAVKGKEKPIKLHIDNEGTSSEETPAPQPRITRSKKARPKEQANTNLNSNTSPINETAPVPEVRMTRSKMMKPKKEKIDSNCRSGEESDSRSDFHSCSDGETGKKTVKDIVKFLNGKHAMVLISPVKLTKEQEKENQHAAGILRMLNKKEKRTPSTDRRCMVTKTTPLQIRNGYVTPNKRPVPMITSATRNKTIMDDAEKRKKEEEARRKRQKEEEALRKKQDMMKLKQEELKRKHDEKMLKAAAMREAAEKEKTECILKQEKEREERERLAKAEIERKKMEDLMKKRAANNTKAAEVETRRLKEEAARLARLKEMEEEQRHQEELRLKQQEENERILKQRTEIQKAKENLKLKALQQKELLKKQKTNIIPIKDKDNYSITGDLAADDDDEDEDEESSKKDYPSWARKEERLLPSRIQVYYPIHRVMEFFCCPSSSPDLTDIFGKMTMKRIRSSSAVWLDSPPLKVYHPIAN